MFCSKYGNKIPGSAAFCSTLACGNHIAKTNSLARRAALMLALVVIAASLAACGNVSTSSGVSDNTLQGTYALQSSGDSQVSIDFNADGSCLLHDGNGSYPGEYKFFDSSKMYSITFKDANGVEGNITFVMEDGRLVMEDGSSAFAKVS